MTELREKINYIILSYCEGHYHLEFTEDDLPNILNEIEEAINYNRCCTEFSGKIKRPKFPKNRTVNNTRPFAKDK